MSSFLEDILKKLGWEDGFQIPVANAENQKLEAEVAKLTLDKLKAKNEFESSTTKVENLEGHVKYITQECEQNQNLITAHIQQLHVEEDKLQASQAERNKCEADIRQTEKTAADIRERSKLQRTDLERCAKKLNKMKSETDWDSEALKAWEEALQKRDEDNELIKQFSKEDTRKYNELEAKRQNLEMEFVTRQKTIEKMVCDLSNYERMLERSGKVIKQQVLERNALIQQWKDSVRVLHNRDVEIDRMQAQILETQEIIEKEVEKLEEQKQFHENEMENNRNLERDTQQLNYQNSRLRRELDEVGQYLLLLNTQLDGVRRDMSNIARLLEKERYGKKEASETIKKLEQKIAQATKKLEALQEKKELLKQSTSTGGEHAKQLEKVIDYEQKQQRSMEHDSALLQNEFIRAQSELQDQVNLSKTREIEIVGKTTNIEHLRKHNEEQRKATGKRKEDAYELDFKIDEIQRKILIQENVIYDEDEENLQVKLLELESTMGEHNETKNLLKDQVNKIRDDMRRLTTAIVADQDKLVLLKDKLQHQNLCFEGGQKQLKLLKTEIQEKQVEENVLRLRVTQLSKAMKKQENSIYTMKRFKLTLEQATKERLIEIETNKEILLVKRRNLAEDKGRMKCDIVERRIKLEQFQKKYDIVLTSLGKDEDGQPLSVVYFKIKNAQEKFLLQQEGDELDNKIKKAEKEILAMENTLKVVNMTNAAFKQSLAPVQDDGKEVNEMKHLENELLLVNDSLRENRKKLADKRQEVEEAKAAFQALELKNAEEQEKLVELKNEYIKVHTEKLLKEEKLKRAEQCLQNVSKKLQPKQREKHDRDLEIRQLRDANAGAMQRLQELSVRYQEISPLITRYALEYGIKLAPKKSLSKLSTSTESTRSSVSCSKEPSEDSRSTSSEYTPPSSSISKVTLTFHV